MYLERKKYETVELPHKVQHKEDMDEKQIIFCPYEI